MRFVCLIAAGLSLAACAADPVMGDTRNMTPEQRAKYEADLAACYDHTKTQFITAGAGACMREKGYKLIMG